MNTTPQKYLFVDRDGTLIEEPPDEQVDSLEKVRWMPGVFAALQQLVAAGYRLVMVTNQDGLGTPGFPRERFDAGPGLRAATRWPRRASTSPPCASARTGPRTTASAASPSRAWSGTSWRATASTLPSAP